MESATSMHLSEDFCGIFPSKRGLDSNAKEKTYMVSYAIELTDQLSIVDKTLGKYINFFPVSWKYVVSAHCTSSKPRYLRCRENHFSYTFPSKVRTVM